MGERKEEDLYRNFSRKDLQGLCKKYGLPANKSNSEMATSLILYLENKNLSSRAIWEGSRSELFSSGMTKLQAGVKMNLTDDSKKDCRCIASRSGSRNYRHRNHHIVQQNDLSKGKGSVSSDKASEDAGNLTQLHKESNSVAGIQENTFSSVVSSSAVAPSPTFTYDVYSEDGIQLYVDLNSSPSDWIENLKAEVHICHHVQQSISQSFHQDIGLLCSSMKKIGPVIMDPSKDADNGQLDVVSSPFTVVADIQGETEEPDGLKVSSNAFNSLIKSQKEQAILSSKVESDTKDILPGILSSKIDEALAADLGSNVAVHPGMCCDVEGNSVPSDPKCPEYPGHQGASIMYEKPSLQQTHGSLSAVLECGQASKTICTEIETSTCATLSHDFENSPSGVHRGINLTKQLNNSEVAKSVTIPMRSEPQSWPVQAADQIKFVSSTPVSKVEPQQDVTSLIRKTEKQIRESHTLTDDGSSRTQELSRGIDEEKKKEAAVHSCCNDGPFDTDAVAQRGGNQYNSSKSIEVDICRIPSASDVEKLDTRDHGNGSKELECLNHECQREISRKIPANSESNGELKRKRHTNGPEVQSKYVNREAKVLRSSKQFGRDDHSKRRRSSRLFTK